MPLDDRIDDARLSENQIASQSKEDGRIGVRHATVDDLQVRCELEPGCDGDVVEELHTGAVAWVEKRS